MLGNPNGPLRIKSLYRRLRSEIRKAEANGYGWRSVIDAMRPYTQTLWKALVVEEKRKALDYFYSWWNIHRHRIPPQSHQVMTELLASGKLSIYAADIYHVGGKGNHPLSIAYRKRGSDKVSTLQAAYVMNCSGPELDIAKSRNPLLLHMRDKGLISVGPLRAGIELNEQGRVKGKAERDIYALGPLLVGELLETTAVPELRGQAKALADTIVLRAEEVYNDRNIFI